MRKFNGDTYMVVCERWAVAQPSEARYWRLVLVRSSWAAGIVDAWCPWWHLRRVLVQDRPISGKRRSDQPLLLRSIRRACTEETSCFYWQLDTASRLSIPAPWGSSMGRCRLFGLRSFRRKEFGAGSSKDTFVSVGDKLTVNNTTVKRKVKLTSTSVIIL